MGSDGECEGEREGEREREGEGRKGLAEKDGRPWPVAREKYR